jgi:hypothetical protein
MRELTFKMLTDLHLSNDITEYCDEHNLDESKITSARCGEIIDTMIRVREIAAVYYDDLWDDLYRHDGAWAYRGYNPRKEDKKIEAINLYIEDHYEEVEFGGVIWMIKIK